MILSTAGEIRLCPLPYLLAVALTTSSSRVLSGTVVPLFISYQIHNVVSWLKIRFFLPKWGAMLYIGSLILVQPYWVLLPIGVFNYVNNLQRYWGEIFLKIRPWESFLRYIPPFTL